MPLCKPGANDEIISTQNNHTGPAVDGDVNNGLTKPPASSFTLGGFSIDEPRPMKVVVIGAGYSGIVAGIRFLQRVRNIDFTMYDSNAGIGGTWYVNRYPGLACDIPSHCYQLSFEDNTNWSTFYASGTEILTDLERVVDKYKLRPHIRLQHRISRATYNEAAGKWHLTIRRPRLSEGGQNQDGSSHWDWNTDFEEFEDTADVVLSGLGVLNRWSWPDIEGLQDFQGSVIHSAQWETKGSGQGWEKDWSGKRVGVIGVGSSAIQIVPALQPKVARVFNYVRGKTWVADPILKDILTRLAKGQEVGNYTFTSEDKEAFKDHEQYKKFRLELENNLNSAHAVTLIGSAAQRQAREAFKAHMVKKLAAKPWIADYLLPDFAVTCRRLTPGPGYLDALCQDNVDFVPTHIKRITATGIETVDGKHQELDIIVCATGFDTTFRYDFPVIGRNGVNLRDKYTPHPRTYLSVAIDGFPNWFQSLGPNSAVGAGSLLLVLERQIDYAVAATLKMQRERLKSMEVKREAVDDFDEYLEHYFKTTVFSQKCRSWYKLGEEEGRVVALWPGSCLHAVRALENPRWEDYNYEPLDGVRNRFHWLGDGSVIADKDPDGDKAWYLRDENIDYPPVPV